MHKEIEFFLETVKIQSATLRDLCHHTLKNHTAELESLNRIWLALDLLDMSVDRTEKEIRAREWAQSVKDHEVRSVTNDDNSS
jgi:hypothetical protein